MNNDKLSIVKSVRDVLLAVILIIISISLLIIFILLILKFVKNSTTLNFIAYGLYVLIFISLTTALILWFKKRHKESILIQNFSQHHGFLPTDKEIILERLEQTIYSGQEIDVEDSFRKKENNLIFNLYKIYWTSKSPFESNNKKYILSDKITASYIQIVFEVQTPKRFKELLISNLSVSKKLLYLIPRITFESNNFNNRYYVEAENQKDAYHILDPLVISKLEDIGLNNFSLLLDSNIIFLIIYNKINNISILEKVYHFLDEFAKRITK